MTEADFFEGSRLSIHGTIAQRHMRNHMSYMLARRQSSVFKCEASGSEPKPTPVGNFNQSKLDADCWFEIIKLLNAKERANMKLASKSMYTYINASTLYCDLTKSTIFTRILNTSGDTSNFQRVSVTAETMEAQPFWHLDIHGARNENTADTGPSRGVDLMEAMASLSHPRRVVWISIDPTADVGLMILVWKAYLQQFCNLRYLSIVECSESLPVQVFETHKALNSLEYEVDVIEQAEVAKRRLLWTCVAISPSS